MRNLRDRFGPTKHLKKTLLALIMDLSNLWKHCYRHTHASFHKVQMNVAYRYQHVTVSLHYLPRCVRSTVSCNKTPATVKAVAHMAICGAAAVALAPGRAGAQCTHAAGAAGGSTAGCPRVKFSLQRSLRPSRIFSSFPLKPRGAMKLAYVDELPFIGMY